MRLVLAALAIFIISAVSASALQLGVGKGQIVNLKRPAAHVFIADPEIADVDVRSPNYIYVYGLKIGETSLHALDANGQQIVQMDLNVSPNTGSIGKILKEVMPDSKIRFTSSASGLVLQGEVNTPEEAAQAMNIVNASLGDTTKVVNALKIRGSDQVMLRVRVAEVSRSELKQFGINLSSILRDGTFAFGLATGRPFTDPVTGGFIRNGNNVTLQGSPGRFNLTGVIDALETQGLIKVLAEPNLTARSGEAASFLAGGEFPIPIPQQNGVTTIEYREYGVRLDFTPTVISGDKISLKVAPEVSSLAPSAVTIQNNNIPTLLTRKASTTVELGSGESFSIAGLMRNDVTNNVDKFPWLGDIPVLGTLFRSNEYQNDESELVIVITPYIVRGVKESEKLLTPTDGFEVPNDFERILLGKTYKEKELGKPANGITEATIAKRKLNGDPGYILEE